MRGSMPSLDTKHVHVLLGWGHLRRSLLISHCPQGTVSTLEMFIKLCCKHSMEF